MEVVRTQDEQHKIERSLHMVAGKRWQPIGKANLAKQNPENGNRDALPRLFRRRHLGSNHRTSRNGGRIRHDDIEDVH